MRITRVTPHAISVPLKRTFWMSREPYRTASEIIVEVTTDEGITGHGQIHGRPMAEIVDLLEQFGELITGMDALSHLAVWHKLFDTTTSRARATMDRDMGQPHFGAGKNPQILAAIAGIDIALWDIKGKALGLPVWKLLGGENRPVFCYGSGGYYEEGESPLKVVDEMAGYVELGYRAVKMKCGGLDIAGDVERISKVREAIGDAKLMIDATSAYTLEEATDAIRAFAEHGIFWFEEPLHWYDAIRGLARLAARTHVDLASGESELERWSSRDLIDQGAVRYVQFDCTRGGGVTEFLRIAAYADMHGLLVAPHHDPQIHGHLVMSAPNGFGLESFPNEERDPLWKELYADRPEITNGMLNLTDKPGFGFEIDWKTVDRYRV
ncbi:MAG: mandelate racemase/muconate lactonizing enzyme family protein [Alphaproteobacteria bacterium]